MMQQIGKYRILERVGRGGMGSVFKAHDPVLDRLVALKVISAEADVTDELRARFFREAQACAKLSHPNIVTIHDLGEADGNLFIVMELLEGGELRQLIAKRAIVHLEDKLSLMVQICEGLHFAHEKGIVHRDVKPGNIFVLRTGQVKILDFGIAHIEAAQSSLTRTGLIMGTLQYMAPERVRGQGDHRSDIFSVGAVCFELLTGRPPFQSDDPMEILEKLRTQDPPRVETLEPTLPAELGLIVERALLKDPARRYASLGQMRGELLPVRQKLGEEVERLRREVQPRLRQLREVRQALAARVGGPGADETELVVDERTPLATLQAIDRDVVARLERLRGVLSLAESLQVAFDRGLEALRAGEADKAVSDLEYVVRQMPDHARAVESLDEARRRADEQRWRREQLVTQMREARAAHDAGAYSQCLESLRRLVATAPPADLQVEIETLRRSAEAGLAREQEAEAARREALRRAREAANGLLRRCERARSVGEAAQAARHAAVLWDQAEMKLAEGQAALAEEAYPEGEKHLEEACQLYEQAEAVARVAQAAAAAAERRAQELAAPAAPSVADSVFTARPAATVDLDATIVVEAPTVLIGAPAVSATEVAPPMRVDRPRATAASTYLSIAWGRATALIRSAASEGSAVAVRGARWLRENTTRWQLPAPRPRHAALGVAAALVLTLGVSLFYLSRPAKPTGAATQTAALTPQPATQSLDDARRAVEAARARAVAAQADTLAGGALALAREKEAEADRLATADATAAAHAYRQAAERYGEAERQAQLKGQERRAASEQFAKATKSAPPSAPADPRAEIRALLTEYVRAMETKNLDLLRRVRPGLTEDELRRLRASFEIKRSHKVEMRVYEITVTGDEAQALGRREDVVVLASGQRLNSEAKFTYTLKRGPRGWFIETLQESTERPARGPRSDVPGGAPEAPQPLVAGPLDMRAEPGRGA